MEPAPRKCSFLKRVLLLAIAALALRLLYGAFLSVSDSWTPLHPAVALTARTYARADVAAPDAWRSRRWRRAVDRHAALLAAHLADGLLAPHSRAVCLGAAHEAALAMRELGVSGAVAVASDVPFADASVDFVFAGRALDSAARPADLAAEAARILKPEGHLVVLTSSAADAYSLRSLQLVLPSLRLLRSRRDITSSLPETSLQELVFQKPTTSSSSFAVAGGTNNNNNCSIDRNKLELVARAEPLIREEPRKPWITLKRNINNIRYLPTLADISFKRRYVYVDVGARSYGSSIGGWFRKRYPKHNHTFHVFAVEADPAFHSQYAARKGVTLLPYAAWVTNGTLAFEINDDPGKQDQQGHRGMGRIRPTTTMTQEPQVTTTVPAFDFADWLKRTVSQQDYVVIKMDVEGTEFDLIPRLFDTGAICLVDELFLECHYNRWQKCCPGQRSPKYHNTYQECLELFTSLRDSGVLVHQWW